MCVWIYELKTNLSFYAIKENINEKIYTYIWLITPPPPPPPRCTLIMFFLKHAYKNDLSVLIELYGLILA